MGGAVSAGEDNDNLVENLVNANYIRSEKLIDIFRAVDRGHYYLKGQRLHAYHDVAWKCNHLHLSAPCIYSEVMEHLDLKPGMSFLNLGSGTGYLSTMVGLILGANGINHGIEIHADVVEYAQDRLEEFMEKSVAFDRFEFCEPRFTVGNCLQLPPDVPLYDRVYCGAACPPQYSNYLMNLLKIGGKLVLPLEDQLQVKTRTGEQVWESENALAVSFATLILPENKEDITLVPDRTVAPLQELCRFCVRREIRKRYKIEMPPKKVWKKRERRQSLGSGKDERSIGRHKVARMRRRRVHTIGEEESRNIRSEARNIRRRKNTAGESYKLSDDSEETSSDETDSDCSEQEMETVVSEMEGEKDTELQGTSSNQTKQDNDSKYSEKREKDTNDSPQSSTVNEPMEIGENKNSRNRNTEAGDSSPDSSTTRCASFKFLRRRKTAETMRNNSEEGEGATPSDRQRDTQEIPEEENATNSAESPNTSEEIRSIRVRALRPGHILRALMQGLRQNSLDSGPPSDLRLLAQRFHDEHTNNQMTSDSEPEESDLDSDKNCGKGSSSESEEIFQTLPESPFTIAIRKLPLPAKMTSYLLYHRQ